MPAIEDMARTDFAVLWPASNGRGGNYGEPSTSSPVELSPLLGTGVRFVPGGRGTNPQSGTTDEIALVGSPIAVGSRMFIGKLSDLPNPNVTPELLKVSFFQVIDYHEHEDIKGREKVKVVYLQRQNSKVVQA